MGAVDVWRRVRGSLSGIHHPLTPHLLPSISTQSLPVSNSQLLQGSCHCHYECVTLSAQVAWIRPLLSLPESLYKGVGSLLTLHPSTPTFLPLPVQRLICVSFPSLAGDIGLPEAHMRWELAAAGQQGLHTAPAWDRNSCHRQGRREGKDEGCGHMAPGSRPGSPGPHHFLFLPAMPRNYTVGHREREQGSPHLGFPHSRQMPGCPLAETMDLNATFLSVSPLPEYHARASAGWEGCV